jgi:Flp pilus assembly protein CpaB
VLTLPVAGGAVVVISCWRRRKISYAVEALRSAGGFPVLICEKDSRRMEQLKRNNLDLEPWQFVEDVFSIVIGIRRSIKPRT